MGISTGVLPYILATRSSGGGREIAPVLITVGTLIAVVLIAGIVLFVLRSRLLGGGSGEGIDAGGVLETMRAMRDRGELSEEEYRQAQTAIVAKASREDGDTAAPRTPEPVKDRTGATLPGEVRAAPGFDLTGEPLPPAARDEPDSVGGDPDGV